MMSGSPGPRSKNQPTNPKLQRGTISPEPTNPESIPSALDLNHIPETGAGPVDALCAQSGPSSKKLSLASLKISPGPGAQLQIDVPTILCNAKLPSFRLWSPALDSGQGRAKETNHNDIQ